MLYDFYSEDLSEKVKTSLKTIRSNGNYVAAYAPYGYMKSPEDKHQLVIDEVVFKIVKRIFIGSAGWQDSADEIDEGDCRYFCG